LVVFWNLAEWFLIWWAFWSNLKRICRMRSELISIIFTVMLYGNLVLQMSLIYVVLCFGNIWNLRMVSYLMVFLEYLKCIYICRMRSKLISIISTVMLYGNFILQMSWIYVILYFGNIWNLQNGFLFDGLSRVSQTYM
jgi:hypothetical protein